MARVKYSEMIDVIEDDINRGKLKNNDKLPTEAQLSSTYGISRQTVRNGLSKLIEKGLLKSAQGSGYYVTSAKPVHARKKHIAVITTYISDYIFPAILRTVQETVSSAGYSLSLYATNNNIISERSVLLSLDADSVDGIIVEGTRSAFPNPNTALYSKLADDGIKIVFFNSAYPGLTHPNIKSILMDDAGGGSYLAERLISRGYSDIGVLMKNDDLQGVNRFAGVVNAMFSHDILLEEQNTNFFTTTNRFIEGDTANFTYKLGLEVIKRCSAIVCYNDQAAARVMDMLAENEHITKCVYSFDNYNSIVPVEGVEFWSLGYPRETIGTMIAEKLLRMIDGHAEKSEVIPWIIHD